MRSTHSSSIYTWKRSCSVVKFLDSPCVGTSFHQAVKSRSPKPRSRRSQSERTIRMRARPQINVGATAAGKCHLHTRIGLPRNTRHGINSSIDDFPIRFETPQPAGITEPPRFRLDSTTSLLIPFATSRGEIGKFSSSIRRLMNSTSSQRQKSSRQVHLAPNFEIVRSGVFVEMPHAAVHGIWIERRSPQDREVRDKARPGSVAQLQMVRRSDPLVHAAADRARLSKNAIEPRRIRAADLAA